MKMHQPIDIALGLVVTIFDEQSRELVLGAIETLSGQLHADSLAAAHVGPVGEQIACLRVKVGVQDGEGGEHGVERLQGCFALAEEVF